MYMYVKKHSFYKHILKCLNTKLINNKTGTA